MNHNGKSRDELAREANQVRTKLLRTVEQLDRRRHDALELRVQVQRHMRQLVVAGSVILLGTCAAMVLVVQRISTATDRRRRNRWKLAKGVWQHPERALRAGRRTSFLGALLRPVVLALANVLLVLPARRLILRLLPPATPAPADRPAAR
jgi:hypothetical protein